MEDKRRSKRLKAHLVLHISNLFKQNHEDLGGLDAPIEVVDVSKHGIGFNTTDIIPLDYYFNAALNLGDAKDCLYCVVKIVRCVALDNGMYNYGCEFVGMAPVLSYIFDDYEKELEAHNS